MIRMLVLESKSGPTLSGMVAAVASGALPGARVDASRRRRPNGFSGFPTDQITWRTADSLATSSLSTAPVGGGAPGAIATVAAAPPPPTHAGALPGTGGPPAAGPAPPRVPPGP